jgi:hypothetical protein
VRQSHISDSCISGSRLGNQGNSNCRYSSALSRRLDQIRCNLLEGLGIEVTISRKNKSKANTAYIEIRKIPPMSPMPPLTRNHEGNNAKTAKDISSNGDIMPPANKIPPVQDYQNHAQKSEIGDTGGIGGIYPPRGQTIHLGSSVITVTALRQIAMTTMKVIQ